MQWLRARHHTTIDDDNHTPNYQLWYWDTLFLMTIIDEVFASNSTKIKCVPAAPSSTQFVLLLKKVMHRLCMVIANGTATTRVCYGQRKQYKEYLGQKVTNVNFKCRVTSYQIDSIRHRYLLVYRWDYPYVIGENQWIRSGFRLFVSFR